LDTKELDLVMPEKSEQDNHGNGHTEEPQKYAASKTHVFPFPFPSGARIERVHDLKCSHCPITLGESAGSSYEQASGKLSWSVIASRKKSPDAKAPGLF
jgi:hypothetical protein